VLVSEERATYNAKPAPPTKKTRLPTALVGQLQSRSREKKSHATHYAFSHRYNCRMFKADPSFMPEWQKDPGVPRVVF
jgi:hypothetical protein